MEILKAVIIVLVFVGAYWLYNDLELRLRKSFSDRRSFKVLLTLYLLLWVIGCWIFYQSYQQACLGIFEEKRLCEMKREEKVQARICRDKYDNECEWIREESRSEETECILEHFCSCMEDRLEYDYCY